VGRRLVTLWPPRSFQDKLTWLVTATSAVAILVVASVLATANHLNLRRSAFAALDAQVATTALNSGAPLVFGDRETANEVLAALRAMPSVESATLYTLRGTPFARYQRAVARERLAVPMAGERLLARTVPVEEKGQLLGRLQVVYDLTELRSQLWKSVLLTALVVGVAILLAFLASRYLAALVTRPIAVLARTARRVSESRDYSLRASTAGTRDDELGAFTGTFNEMLERIEQQDSDLKESRAQAEAASRMKDEFLATLSHELRTPMTPILGWSQILKRLSQDEPKVLQAATVIERNALVQTRIIDDLLDMSRIVSGKIRLDIRGYDLAEVVDAAVEAVQAAASARGIALEASVDRDVPPLRGDPERIQQVVWNLLANAIKFTADGTVRVAAHLDGSTVRVVVSDTGLGIGPEFLPHVFERFRQADSSATREHGGLGLGLSIVKQLVELHGGSVAVASAGRGEGTTFTITLPVVRGTRVAVRPSVAAGAIGFTPGGGRPLSGLSVVVVDDEADARDWIGRVLADSGAQASVVGSADEALQRVRDFRPDVLVSDIGMPGTDGYALIRLVRALPGEQATVPAIALTAFARNDDRARALAAGFQMHLGKPIDEDELVAAVASVARSSG
jgi:signal transduction histidine kinase/CheY-like chemotaxis protein